MNAPALHALARFECEVGGVVSLGSTAAGERRYVPLLGGTVQGPELNGRIVEGGIDWQWQRGDGVLEIAAHYVIATDDSALIEVKSDGLRHGPPDVMAALARGEPVDAGAYYFRTALRFHSGHAAWAHLNRVLALAVGRRDATRVLLDVWRVG